MRKWIFVVFALVFLAEPVYAKDLTAVGRTVGIRLQEDGVTITGFTDVGDAEKSGLQAGDRIIKINGTAIASAAEISSLTSSGEPVAVTVERGGKTAEYLLTPVQDGGRWLLGLRIRDSICGIGTVTFYDPESGLYGALGHGVRAMEKDELLTITEGEIVRSSVTGCEMGRHGSAGQLLGEFDRTVCLGTVEKNTNCGIFGKMSAGACSGEPYPVAARDDIHTGDAVILSNVAGMDVQEYDVRILKIYPGEAERNLLLEVTDKDLLRQTGGIVQGMSGSPIIQDGKLVGAVTHVLVADPTKGYGIFVENMLSAAG